MGRGWFTGPGIGVLNGIFLRLDCTNDPLTAGLEINAATAGEPVLTLLTTDDNITNPYLDLNNSGTPMPYIIEKDGTRFLHTYGTDNLFLGPNAGNFTLVDSANVGIGESALTALTGGYRNVAIGALALTSTTLGDFNMAFGWGALRFNVTGSYATAIGSQALYVNTTSFNTGIGFQALASNTVGGYNVAIGPSGLLSNINGAQNVSIGTNALRQQTSASDNIGIGYRASQLNVTGTRNVTIGSYAGYGVAAQSRSNNVLIGYYAGYSLGTGGDANVFIGYQAGRNETLSNRLYIANSNTATPLIYGEFDTWRLAFGNQYAVDKYGQLAHASGFFAAVGDAQGSPDSFIVRRAVATHAVNTWYALYPDGGTTPERLTIAADTGWSIDVLVIGLTQNAAQQWGYQIYGVLERDNAGNTTLAATATTVLFESDANYDAQLANDDANEALEVQVRRTGGVDYDIRWVATVRTVEASYPS